MILKQIPRIDVHQITRDQLKALKLKGSQSSQVLSLVDKATAISREGLGSSKAIDQSLTLPNQIIKKLNII